MGLDEEISRLKREGTEQHKIIIAYVRAGGLSRKLVGLAASLNDSEAQIAAKLLNIPFKDNFKKWHRPYRAGLIRSVAQELAATQYSFVGIKKPRDAARRLTTLFACDVVEHVYEEYYDTREIIDEALAMTRKLAAGARLAIGDDTSEDVEYREYWAIWNNIRELAGIRYNVVDMRLESRAPTPAVESEINLYLSVYYAMNEIVSGYGSKIGAYADSACASAIAAAGTMHGDEYKWQVNRLGAVAMMITKM